MKKHVQSLSRGYIRKKLAHFEMPRKIILLKEMPHNVDTGKIDIKSLK